jgi:hypothetical protein
MNIKLVSSVVVCSLTAFYISQNRYFRLKTAKNGQKIRTIVEQVVKGNLNDRVIQTMLDVLSTEMIGVHDVNTDLVYKAGFELAKYGTPHSCLLAMHLSNYTGVKYSETIIEIIREASCFFIVGSDYSSVSRIVEIVRGKYLYEDYIHNDKTPETERTIS